MADVAAKIISANDVRRGTIICSINGHDQVKNTEKTQANHDGGTPTALEARYGERFDDKTYYTA
jgi:hypothetical protein